MTTMSAGNATATFQSSSTELAMNVRKLQHLMTQNPRSASDLTETAKQLLLSVRDIRSLVSAATALPSFRDNDALAASYQSLAAAVSKLIQLAREDTLNKPIVDTAPVRDATSSIVTAIRAFQEIVPKSMSCVPAAAFVDMSRRRRSNSMPDDRPVAPAVSYESTTTTPQQTVQTKTRAPAQTAAPAVLTLKSPPESPRTPANEHSTQQFQQAMSRLSQMLDDEIAAVKPTPAYSNSTPKQRPVAATMASTTQSHKVATLSHPNSLSAGAPLDTSPRHAVLTPTINSNKDANNKKDETIASLQRHLDEANARFAMALERGERLESENEALVASSSASIAEKTAEIEKLNREIKVLKHVSTAPQDWLATMQNRGESEAAHEKLKSDHEEMIQLANAEFARKDRELSLIRQLALEPPFDGWLAKQGGGNLSRAWKDRFFVLRSGVLSYFHNEDDEKPAGFTHIADATVEKTSSAGREFTFTVCTAKRAYFIAAQSQTQMDAWVDKLTEIIKIYAELFAMTASRSPQATTMDVLWRQRQIQKTKDLLAAKSAK